MDAAQDSEASAESRPSEAPMRHAGQTAPFPETSPLDGSPLDPIAATPLDDIASIVSRARAAQREWARTPVRERAAMLTPLKNRILERAEEIAELLRRECGKPVEEAALAEVLPNADLVEYWTNSIEELLEPANV